MDATDPLIGLFGLRAPDPGAAEALAAFALGLFVAAVVAAAPSFRRWSARRDERRERAREVEAAMAGRSEDRGPALMRLAQRDVGPGAAPWRARSAARLGLPPEAFGGEGDALYRRDGPAPDVGALAAALKRDRA